MAFTIQNSSIIQLLFRHILNLICLLAIFLPFSFSFNPNEYQNQNEGWARNYVYEYTELMIFVGAFVVIWICIQFIQYRKIKSLLTILGLLLASLHFFNSCSAVTMPAQDFYPDWGIFLMIFVLPLLWAYSYLDKLKERQDNIPD